MSKASYNDLIQEFNQINQAAKELTANRELDRIKKIQQYDSLLQKTVALMEHVQAGTRCRNRLLDSAAPT